MHAMAHEVKYRQRLADQSRQVAFEVIHDRSVRMYCGMCYHEVARFEPDKDTGTPPTFRGHDVYTAMRKHCGLVHPLKKDRE